MTCPHSVSVRLAVSVSLALALLLSSSTWAQQGDAPRKTQPGQFFPVVEPIDQDLLETIRASTLPYIKRVAEQKKPRPILVFEFRPGDSAPGESPFGISSDLADFIAYDLQGAEKTVAFVPEPLSGYAVLPVLACDEIVMGPEATLGPITPPDGRVNERERAAIKSLAMIKGRDPELLLGMLEPEKDLKEVRLADRQIDFVSADELEAYRQKHPIEKINDAWEGGQRGILTAERARTLFVRLLATDRAEVAEAYRLASTTDDPTLAGEIKPIRIRIEGPLDPIKESSLARHIRKAQSEDINLIFFEFNSPGGQYEPADKLADQISRLKGIRTIAFLDDRAQGVASLLPIACDEIVFRSESRLGGRAQELDERITQVMADKAQEIAHKKGHPEAVARALVDPMATVHLARDADTGAVRWILDTDLQANPARYQVVETPNQSPGEVLMLDDRNAAAFGMSNRVVKDLDELLGAYGLSGDDVRLDRATWVDTVVETLNASWMKGLLLFVGFFMLVLELKLPGVGLPAITAALAFLLYFWSSYLGGTADQLEILLFVVGIVCLALELFVFPGLGVFGVSGVLLILISVVMASHTFVWPEQDYEFRQMGRSLLRITAVLAGVIAGAIAFGRYFPSLPLFNRLVLVPEPSEGASLDPTMKPPVDSETTLFFLIGEIGRTTTVLRPSGKARFGELLVDVTADGFFIEANQPVEVVEVRGSRVIVKRV